MPKKRVVIIGAGFAGLGAARTIQGSGKDVETILLEAGDCVGGRARSATLPSGTRVEAGATWFHGVCGNPLYEIAVWEGLVQDLRADPEELKHNETNWKVDFARPFSTQLLSHGLKDVAEEALERFQKAALELSGDVPSSEASIGDFMRKRFDQLVKSQRFSPEELSVFAESWLFRDKQQCSFDGFFSTDDVSATFPWEFETLEGPNMPVPGGFQLIAEALASPLDIRYGHRVTSIDWGSGGVNITCSNGVELEADAVVVTTSVGVLQAHHRTLFKPPLPDWKQAALGAVRLGVADKIFVEFEVQQGEAMQEGCACSTASASSSRQAARPRVRTRLQRSASAAPAPCASSSSAAVKEPAGSGGGEAAEECCTSHSTIQFDVSADPHHSSEHRRHSAEYRPYHHHHHHHSHNHHHGLQQQRQDEEMDNLTSEACSSGACAPGVASGRSSASEADVWCEQPWIMGRRGLQAQTELTSRAALAATGAVLSRISSCSSFNSLREGSAHFARAQGPSRAQQQQQQQQDGPACVRTYVFMWPLSDPMELGNQGKNQPDGLPHAGLCPVSPELSRLAALPSWLRGLHSIRFSPGPDWIQASDHPLLGGQGQGRMEVPAEVEVEDLDLETETGDSSSRTVGAVLWITGNAALEMEQQSDQAVQQGIMQLLDAFPAIPLPAGALLRPRVVRTRWGSDPHFLGSYSYTRAGMDSGDVVEHMAAPLSSDDGIPVVMFAGEATHRQYMGTAHGAYMSGFREANRFLAGLEQQQMMMQWSLAKVASMAAGPGGQRGVRHLVDSSIARQLVDAGIARHLLDSSTCSPQSDWSGRLM